MTTPSRPVIARLPPYALAEEPPSGVGRIIQLAQNELGVAPSPRAIEAAAGAVSELNRYPEIDHTGLRHAIAAVHGLDPARVLCGAGSMELMGLLAHVYLEAGKEVVVSELGYKFFQVQCALAGATIRVVPEPDLQIDVEAVAAGVSARTRIVFLVNPGNPTGARLAPEAIHHLRRALPENVMLVLDCAYAEFVVDSNFDNGFARVDGGENVVILRTFSKAYGLAALRVGWMYAPHDVVAAIAKARAPNTITTTGLRAAEAALQDTAHVENAIAEVVDLREALRRKALSMGLVANPSDGNFVLIGCPENGPIGVSAL